MGSRAAIRRICQIDGVERERHIERMRRLQSPILDWRLPFERIHVDWRGGLLSLAFGDNQRTDTEIRIGQCSDEAFRRVPVWVDTAIRLDHAIRVWSSD